MKSRVLQFILFAACALLLAACKFQATTTLNPDGSGELRTEVGFTAEERQNLENQSSRKGPDDFCNTSGRTPPDVTVTEEQRGDETWCVTTQKFDNPDELRELYMEQKGIKVNRLEIANGTLDYDIDVDTASEDSGFANFTAITWKVTLPGTPASHNAGQVDGNTLTWNLTPRSGTINLRAESPARGPNSTLPFLIGGAVLLCACGVVALGGMMAFFRLRRSRKPPTPAPADLMIVSGTVTKLGGMMAFFRLRRSRKPPTPAPTG